jgi:hypothetical protein
MIEGGTMAKDSNGPTKAAKPPVEKGGYRSGSRTVSELPPPPRSVSVRGSDKGKGRVS